MLRICPKNKIEEVLMDACVANKIKTKPVSGIIGKRLLIKIYRARVLTSKLISQFRIIIVLNVFNIPALLISTSILLFLSKIVCDMSYTATMSIKSASYI